MMTEIVTCVVPAGTLPLRVRSAMSVPAMVTAGPILTVESTAPAASMNSARTCVLFSP